MVKRNSNCQSYVVGGPVIPGRSMVFALLVESFVGRKFLSFNGRRIYPFNKGLQIFYTLKISTSTYDMKLNLYR